MAQTMVHKTEHFSGHWPPVVIPPGPTTVIYYGYGGEMVEYSPFSELTMAQEFSSFLNSDRIFDCVIPRHFLEPETKKC